MRNRDFIPVSYMNTLTIFAVGLQAIRDSDCYVDDISKANVIFVYDYCYYIWWLAHIHSALGKKVHDTPGDYLIKVVQPT